MSIYTKKTGPLAEFKKHARASVDTLTRSVRMPVTAEMDIPFCGKDVSDLEVMDFKPSFSHLNTKSDDYITVVINEKKKAICLLAAEGMSVMPFFGEYGRQRFIYDLVVDAMELDPPRDINYMKHFDSISMGLARINVEAAERRVSDFLNEYSVYCYHPDAYDGEKKTAMFGRFEAGEGKRFEVVPWVLAEIIHQKHLAPQSRFFDEDETPSCKESEAHDFCIAPHVLSG